MGKRRVEHHNKYSPENRFASELLCELKQGMKRLWIALIIVLGLWFTTIGVFVWYLNQYDFESTQVIEAQQDGSGTNIVGGGDVNYGTSGADNKNQDKNTQTER